MYLFITGFLVGICVCIGVVSTLGKRELEKRKQRQRRQLGQWNRRRK